MASSQYQNNPPVLCYYSQQYKNHMETPKVKRWHISSFHSGYLIGWAQVRCGWGEPRHGHQFRTPISQKSFHMTSVHYTQWSHVYLADSCRMSERKRKKKHFLFPWRLLSIYFPILICCQAVHVASPMFLHWYWEQRYIILQPVTFWIFCNQ